MSLYKDYLMHHGIKGQKHGVRNGPPYPLNRDSKGHVVKSKKKTSKPIDRNNILSMDGASHIGWGKFDQERDKRYIDAAKLGVKALEVEGEYDIEHPENDPEVQSWFLFEDQTIGLPMIADMVNQGYSRNQIINFLDKESKKPYSYDDEAIFNAHELFFNDPKYRQNTINFIDNCIKYK